jgi:hypothetical protein
MDIFEITKKFPKEETYSLIDQIREVHVRFAVVLQNLTENTLLIS